MLHGFSGSPASWDGLISDDDVALELVGHGGPLSKSFAWEVERIAGEIAARATGGVQLVGYSMGARIALGVACSHRDLIERLILVGVHPGFADRAARLERERADARWCRLLHERGIDAFIDAWEALPMWSTQSDIDPAARARQRQIRTSHDAAGLAHALRVAGLGAMPSLWSRLASIRAPVRLICGQRDDKFRAIAERAATQLPHAAIDVVAGAGHNPILEAPRAIAAIIDDRSN